MCTYILKSRKKNHVHLSYQTYRDFSVKYHFFSLFLILFVFNSISMKVVNGRLKPFSDKLICIANSSDKYFCELIQPFFLIMKIKVSTVTVFILHQRWKSENFESTNILTKQLCICSKMKHQQSHDSSFTLIWHSPRHSQTS